MQMMSSLIVTARLDHLLLIADKSDGVSSCRMASIESLKSLKLGV